MPLEKGLSSGHEIPKEEQREQDLEEKDQKKDENVENEDEAEEEVIPNKGEEEEDKEDNDGEKEKEDSPDSNSGHQSDQFMEIDLEEIRREVECPICLGIIRKTRTMMKCLHRFCRECIEKSLRLGNNECPACRTHCPTRRSLRDDPNFDAFIAVLFPNIDSFEEEELNEEKARNKEIQESIAQVSERRKRKKGSTSRGTEEEVKTEN